MRVGALLQLVEPSFALRKNIHMGQGSLCFLSHQFGMHNKNVRESEPENLKDGVVDLILVLALWIFF